MKAKKQTAALLILLLLAAFLFGCGRTANSSGQGGNEPDVRSDPETWTLFQAFFQEEQTHLDIREDSVMFRTPVDQDHDIRKTIPLRMERDLRKIDFTGIPRTAEQAKELLPDGDR